MKEFAVTITVPAFADMIVEAETREAAIAQIKENLSSGIELDFDLEMSDPEDMGFFACPLDRENPAPRRPELKDYTVTLEAESYQEVPVKAVSEADALQRVYEMYNRSDAILQRVYEMYNRSDAIDFNDSHVIRIKPGIKDADDPRSAMKGLLENTVRIIRESDCSNSEMADTLQRAIDKVFGLDD